MQDKIVTFSPEAWEQLEWMCRKADTEIGFFGVADDPKDLFHITRLMMPKQECTSVTVAFDDDDINTKCCALYEEGLEPNQVLRHWIHTHPGNSATPSGTDWETLKDRFGDVDWCTMLILAKGGDFSAHLREKTPWYPTATVAKIKHEIVGWEPDETWDQMLKDNVSKPVATYYGAGAYGTKYKSSGATWRYGSYSYSDENWYTTQNQSKKLATPIKQCDDYGDPEMDAIHAGDVTTLVQDFKWTEDEAEEMITDYQSTEIEKMIEAKEKEQHDDLPF